MTDATKTTKSLAVSARLAAQGLHDHVNQLPVVIGLLHPRLHCFVNQFAPFAV